jgi:hypothetical protein
VQGGERGVITAFARLGRWAAHAISWLPTFRDNLSVLSSRIKQFALEDGTDRLSRNVGNHLPTYAAQNPVTAKASSCKKKPQAPNWTELIFCSVTSLEITDFWHRAANYCNLCGLILPSNRNILSCIPFSEPTQPADLVFTQPTHCDGCERKKCTLLSESKTHADSQRFSQHSTHHFVFVSRVPTLLSQ